MWFIWQLHRKYALGLKQENIEVLASNVEAAKDDIESGVVHLDSAARHQRKYRKKMCIMMMILLVMAVLLTLAIYLTSSGGKKK